MLGTRKVWSLLFVPITSSFVSADFFNFAEKGWNTRSLFLPEDRFNRLPVVSYPARSIRTQLVGLFRTKSNKVRLISEVFLKKGRSLF